ncbi:hypothetical protein AAVH_13181 [Aphelenchoides avenae]|nr:hypothetical protein AAVH_13181 [Aphelenchus avenae]
MSILGVRDIEGVKTAERVRECVNSILHEYLLKDDDVAFYVTDNGSNLMKAYRDSIEEVHIVVSDDNADTPGADEADDEDSDGEQQSFRRHTPSARVTYTDPQIEETDCQDDSDQEEDAQAAADVTESEALEREYDATFAKRVSCFDHCLELVLKKVVEKDNKKASSMMRKTRAILRKAKNSSSAKRELRNRCNKSFILPATTRWGSHFMMAERVLEIWKDLNQVWSCKGWPTFVESHIAYLRSFCRIVEPFHSQLMAMQKDRSVTVSKVYGQIKKLSKHCDKFRNEVPDAWALAKGIKAELLKRFGVYIDPKMVGFNPHYAVAATLDPSQAFLVDMDSDIVSRLLLDRIGHDDVQEVVSDTESLEAGDDDAYEEIMRKKRRMQKRASSQQQQNSDLGPNGDEVQKYLDAVLYADFGSTDPLEWWRSEGMAKYPRVYELDMKYLPAPATSASIERSFSQAGLAMGARKGRTLEDLLDMKLMVHINENMSGIR